MNDRYEHQRKKDPSFKQVKLGNFVQWKWYNTRNYGLRFCLFKRNYWNKNFTADQRWCIINNNNLTCFVNYYSLHEIKNVLKIVVKITQNWRRGSELKRKKLWCFVLCTWQWSFGVTLWELFTMATSQPYREIDPVELWSYLERGVRLERPANCPNELFVEFAVFVLLLMHTYRVGEKNNT